MLCRRKKEAGRQYMWELQMCRGVGRPVVAQFVWK